MSPDLLPPFEPWLLCAGAVILGTMFQKLSGAGFGMITAPTMTLVAPTRVPGTILLVGFLVGVGSVLSSRDAVAGHDLPFGFLGGTVGAVIAAATAKVVVGTDALSMVVAFVVLLAVALTLAGISLPITSWTLFGAGTVGGIMGTLTGVGARPMAILYSSVDARRSAATQNAFYGFGMVVSIIALALTGLIRTPQVAFAASLAPLVPLTLYAVRPLATRFERGVIKPWALGLASFSAIVLLAKSL